MFYEKLHEEALVRMKKFTRAVAELLEIITQIDEKRAYLNLGFPSLWSYLTVGLKMSESHAQQFISVSRKSKEVPSLKTAIISGEISLPKAALIVPELKKANQEDWLNKAKELSTRELKLELVKANPLARPMDKITQRTESLVDFKVGLKTEVFNKLKRSQDILCQKKQRDVRYEEVVEFLADFFLEWEERNIITKSNRVKHEQSLCADKVRLPRAARRGVVSTNNHQCSAILSNGKRCSSKRFLHVHHEVPLSKGGNHNIENLRLLCAGHHKVEHTKV